MEREFVKSIEVVSGVENVAILPKIVSFDIKNSFVFAVVVALLLLPLLSMSSVSVV